MIYFKYPDSIAKNIFLFLAIIFCSFSYQSLAKENNAKRNIKDANKAIILPQVTVIAGKNDDGGVDGYKTGLTSSSTRTETSLLDTPQAVSVINQNQIRDQKIVNMEEAIRYVPGINIRQGEGHRDQVTIRGNVSSADFFVDGARDDLEYMRDFYNTERIEVLKGPNAMAFGRGGSGGAINRVLKYADGQRKKSIVLTGGSFNDRRVEADVGDKVNEKLSVRFNSMYEKSDSFRRFVGFEKYAFNPTATIDAGDNTEINVGYEHFRDNRLTDRGIPSSGGGAYTTGPSTFFGNPDQNNSETRVDSVYAIIKHDFSDSLKLKNHTRYTKNYKFYQNTFANGAVASAGTYRLEAYNDTYDRNTFTNQTDLTKKFEIGATKHTALLGAEITDQDTQNLRQTGFFNNSTTFINVPVTHSVSSTPITYRSLTTTNNNSSRVNVLAAYLQDQVEINKYLQVTGGLRMDRFSIGLVNNHTNQSFKRNDTLLSPRFGLVVKPRKSLSIYANYNVTYLPSAGDQFSSMSAAVQALKPEKMENYEIGTKWDITPRLNFTTAFYQLDRTNTRNNDPSRPGFFVLTGASRTRGVELSATGKVNNKWEMIAGYAYQDAIITGTTSLAAKGKKIALVPQNKISLWNKYNFDQKFSAGLGIIDQSSQFAALDNSVKLKGFTRFDVAAYYKVSKTYRLQLNVENIFNKGYIQTAHNNYNILPGTPRMFRISLLADF
jgi:catecholate siderophore receptor